MRGLAITNSPVIRPAHNYLARCIYFFLLPNVQPTYTSRPSDLRASLNNITITTFDTQKRKEKENNLRQTKKTNAGVKPPPAKRAKIMATKAALKGKAKDKEASCEDEEETYHFIGYVPAYGKVWELDGLKSGPLEVGELPLPAHCSSSSSAPRTQPPEEAQNSDWMSVARPALRMKMEKYGGSATAGTNIRFSLLAIVDDLYQKASDELEFLKREKVVLERKLRQQTEQWKGDEWLSKVGAPLLLLHNCHDTYIHIESTGLTAPPASIPIRLLSTKPTPWSRTYIFQDVRFPKNDARPRDRPHVPARTP